jgi:hypothetical protein
VILELDVFVNALCEALNVRDVHEFEDALQHHLESLEVPVLVDDGVDHM